METLIRATQQMIKEEDSLHQRRQCPPDAPEGPANGLPKGPSGACFTPEYPQRPLPLQCRGLVHTFSPEHSPAPLSRLSSPGTERLHMPKDLQTDRPTLCLPLHQRLGRPGTCSTSPTPAPALYPPHTYPRPYLDRHASLSLTGYTPEHLYEPDRTSASSDPPHCDLTPHFHMAAQQTPGHKGPSVIIYNGS